MAQKPLLLKDYLEQDSSSDSSSNSFASFPRRPGSSTTVRFLLDVERCRDGAKLIRSRAKGTFTKLSAVLNALKIKFPVTSPTAPNESGFLSRSISKRFSKKFWKIKSKSENLKVTVKDIVRLNSFELYGERRSLYSPSPAVSSCSSCSEGERGYSESFLSSYSGGSADCSVDSTARNSPPPTKSPIPNRRQPSSEEIERQGTECCQSEEEKEQLSPVSVMDFPYQDEGDDEEEDDEATSPRFEQSLANIERTTSELLQKIRRFEALAELDPLDLELRFASDEDEGSDDGHVSPSEEITAWHLIQRLRTSCQVGPHSDKLLVDFFVQGLSCTDSTPRADVEPLLSTARVWINGGGCLKAEEQGKAQLGEMERNGQWRCFEDGKDDVAADVEGRVLGALLQELVLDLTH